MYLEHCPLCFSLGGALVARDCLRSCLQSISAADLDARLFKKKELLKLAYLDAVEAVLWKQEPPRRKQGDLFGRNYGTPSLVTTLVQLRYSCIEELTGSWLKKPVVADLMRTILPKRFSEFLWSCRSCRALLVGCPSVTGSRCYCQTRRVLGEGLRFLSK
jgi:hypothetical protein